MIESNNNIVFIPHNVPSSKNSRVNGRFFSKTVTKYLRLHGIKGFSSSKKYVDKYKTRDITFPVDELNKLFSHKEYPIIIGFHFVRGSKHKFDFNNVCQILFDLFTAFDIIPDDNMDFVIPCCLFVNGMHYSYNKENPGVYISVCDNVNNVTIKKK